MNRPPATYGALDPLVRSGQVQEGDPVPGTGRPKWWPAPVDPADWTTEQARAAQAELDELEASDPDVAAAAASYDAMVERVTGRRFRTQEDAP